MRYARISVYDQLSGNYADNAQLTEREFGARLRGRDGFVSYSVGRDQNGRIVAVNVWDTHAAAEAGLAEANVWVRENLGDLVRLVDAHIVDFTFTVD